MTIHSWGIYVGNYCRGKQYNIPVVLSTEKGGFCLFYDKKDQSAAESFLENITLNFTAQLSLKYIHIHLWDYAIHKRFPYLSVIEKAKHFYLSQTPENVLDSFHKIEMLVKKRHQHLLDIDTPTLSAYNEKNSHNPQPYHLLLINGDDLPQEGFSLTRWQYFFQAAATAGVFIILFTTEDSRRMSNNQVWDWLKGKLPAIHLKHQAWHFSPEAFKYHNLREWYQFQPLEVEKKPLLNGLSGKTPYSPPALLGENFIEYHELLHDVIQDLQHAKQIQEKIADQKRRLEAAARHHQESQERIEALRREKIRLEAERLERELEIKRQEQENEARYLAMKKAQRMEELAIKKREQREKEAQEEAKKQLLFFRNILITLIALSFLTFDLDLSFQYLDNLQDFSRITQYIKFTALLSCFTFYIWLSISFRESSQINLIRYGVSYSIVTMIAVSSLIFAGIVVSILFFNVAGNLEKFILFSIYNIVTFFVLTLILKR